MRRACCLWIFDCWLLACCCCLLLFVGCLAACCQLFVVVATPGQQEQDSRLKKKEKRNKRHKEYLFKILRSASPHSSLLRPFAPSLVGSWPGGDGNANITLRGLLLHDHEHSRLT